MSFHPTQLVLGSDSLKRKEGCDRNGHLHAGLGYGEVTWDPFNFHCLSPGDSCWATFPALGPSAPWVFLQPLLTPRK